MVMASVIDGHGFRAKKKAFPERNKETKRFMRALRMITASQGTVVNKLTSPPSCNKTPALMFGAERTSSSNHLI